MEYCELTLESAAENLACDEALLDQAEAGLAEEVLRVWEPGEHFVVVGYGNRAATEVNLPFCQLNRIPVLRRCTGGGTVLQGPGCLNYSLILRIAESAQLQSISGTAKFILERHQAALGASLQAAVEMRGQSDLAIGGLKFSGNAQRRRKQFLIFHGTFLLGLDISLAGKALLPPSRQPDYRQNRSHADFLMNLRVPAEGIKRSLREIWGAVEPIKIVPSEQISVLCREKYGCDEWNLKF